MQAPNQELANKYYNRGVAHSKNGDYDCAIEDYTQAIVLSKRYLFVK